MSRVIEHLTLRNRHAEIAHIEPERRKPRDQFGLRNDPRAAAGKFVIHALEDIDPPAAPLKHDGGQKPAHRPADD